MQQWTIKQLMYANEVCSHEDFHNFMKEYLKNEYSARIHYSNSLTAGGLIPWVFTYSRDDMDSKGFSEMIDALIGKMVDGYE